MVIEEYKEDTFRMTCPTCKKRNEVKVFLLEKTFHEMEDFHCAFCGLRIHEIPSAKTPESKIVEDET